MHCILTLTVLTKYGCRFFCRAINGETGWAVPVNSSHELGWPKLFTPLNDIFVYANALFQSFHVPRIRIFFKNIVFLQ